MEFLNNIGTCMGGYWILGTASATILPENDWIWDLDWNTAGMVSIYPVAEDKEYGLMVSIW